MHLAKRSLTLLYVRHYGQSDDAHMNGKASSFLLVIGIRLQLFSLPVIQLTFANFMTISFFFEFLSGVRSRNDCLEGVIILHQT